MSLAYAIRLLEERHDRPPKFDMDEDMADMAAIMRYTTKCIIWSENQKTIERLKLSQKQAAKTAG